MVDRLEAAAAAAGKALPLPVKEVPSASSYSSFKILFMNICPFIGVSLVSPTTYLLLHSPAECYLMQTFSSFFCSVPSLTCFDVPFRYVIDLPNIAAAPCVYESLSFHPPVSQSVLPAPPASLLNASMNVFCKIWEWEDVISSTLICN